MDGPEPEPSGEEPHGLEGWLDQFARDTGLRPVLLVALGSLGAIGAGVVLSAWHDRNLAAIAALALLALGTIDLLARDLRRRRFGSPSRFVTLLWLLSLLGAVVGSRLGLG